jgi:hypothetical protein
MDIDFIVLGAPRCATSWMHKCLSQHPDIFVPKGKETRYFDENYDKTLSYYKEYFKGKRSSCKGRSCDEILEPKEGT